MPPLSKTTDTDKPDDDTPTSESPAAAAALSADKPAADPQHIVIEQAPAEPAVFYGDGGLVPGAHAATDPNKPHVQAQYEPFEW